MIMDRIKINQYVDFSKMIQGFWRANEWQYSDQELNRFINQLVERGITTMDHADIYGDYQCESRFGRALQLSPNLRDQIQVVSKCGIVLPSETQTFTDGHRYDHSRQHIIQSVNHSLQRLNVDYLDSLLIHRPSPLMNPDEITDAVKELVDEGKIKSFGVSNFNETQYDLLKHSLNHDKLHISINQLEVSPYQTDILNNGVMDKMYENQVKVMAWSPLAGGKLFDPSDDKASRVRTIIEPLAQKYEVDDTAIMIAWLNKHPNDIMPVLGTHKIERIDAALPGLSINLTDQECFDIYTAAMGHDIL